MDNKEKSLPSDLDANYIRNLESKVRHMMWALNTLSKLKISRTQRAIIEVALENVEKFSE